MVGSTELLDHVPQGCLVVSEDGKVLFWNRVLELWTGIDRSVIVGRVMYEVFPRLGEPRYRSRIEQTLSLGAPTVMSALLTEPFFSRARNESRRRYEQVIVTRTMSASGECNALITISDLTEQYDRGEKFHSESRRATLEAGIRRVREAELVVMKEAAESANRSKSLFLAAMSHELRTPMNGVLGMADLLLHSELTPWQREHVEILQASASSLLTVLNDILDFSKIEANKLELESIEFDPRSVVEECVVLVAEMAHVKGIECAGVVASSVPRRVLGDPTRFRQVLMNLLSNAVKFTSRGEVVVELSATITDGEGVRLVCAVRDSGGGIPAETRAKLFEPFTQATTATSRIHGGTGLGLSICRRLVRLMGGDIQVASAVGDGSTFRFDFRVGRLEPDASFALARTVSGLRVLVLLEHRAMSLSVLAQLECLGAYAFVPEADELSHVLQRDSFSHVIVDASTFSRHAPALAAGRASVLLATRPLASRGLPPGGVCALVPAPCRMPKLAEMLGLTSPTDRKAPAQVSMRVLVAEDDRTNQIVARGILKSLGCSVNMVADGSAAVEAARTATYDVVLMDMQMPVMGGCEAARLLREGGYTVPILALTASALAEEQAACLAAGMDEVLTKPLERGALVAALGRTLRPDRTAG